MISNANMIKLMEEASLLIGKQETIKEEIKYELLKKACSEVEEEIREAIIGKKPECLLWDIGNDHVFNPEIRDGLILELGASEYDFEFRFVPTGYGEKEREELLIKLNVEERILYNEQ